MNKMLNLIHVQFSTVEVYTNNIKKWHNYPKYLNTYHTYPKFEQAHCEQPDNVSKRTDWVANSVDPDQTAL